MHSMIERYINKMTKADINSFAIKKNINLSESELSFTYEFIKKNWNQILSNPNMLNLNRYKNNFSEENFNKINELIKEYSTKYHRFI